MYTKVVPEKVHYIKFHIKLYLQSFAYNYKLDCIIYFESSAKVFFTTQTSHWNTDSWVKSLIPRISSSDDAPWGSGIPSCMIWLFFSFLSINRNFVSHFFVFLYSNVLIGVVPWYLFPFCSIMILDGIII